MNIAINGFGRIGRNVLRAMLERNVFINTDIKLVAINDIAEPQGLVHLLKYDSTYGRLSDIGFEAYLHDEAGFDEAGFDKRVVLQLSSSHHQANHDSKNPVVQQIEMLNISNPEQLSWQELAVDVVLECTGQFRSYQQASMHRQAGAKQVIIGAAPFDEVDACIVMGVNDEVLTPDVPVVSSVSCTTQAIVPLIATLDQAFGVQSAMMTEIHAVTADQNVLDQAHRDPRRARASGYNIIPTTSSSIAATERVLPNMIGRINGYSMRVPTIDVAAIDVTFTFQKATSLDEIRTCIKQASKGQLQGIMGYTTEPLVSSDFVHQSASLIVDEHQLMQVGEQFKVFAWYDNEWGYANRLVDMCAKLQKLKKN